MNLLKNPGIETSVKPDPQKNKINLPDWGIYCGAGKYEAGLTNDNFHGGKQCLFLKFIDWQIIAGKKMANMGIVMGGANGYSGSESMPVKSETGYEFSFWLKGNIPQLEILGLGWMRNDDKYKRQRIPVSSVRQNGILIRRSGPRKNRAIIKPGQEWKYYSGIIQIPEDVERLVIGLFVKDVNMLRPGQIVYIDDGSIKEIK